MATTCSQRNKVLQNAEIEFFTVLLKNDQHKCPFSFLLMTGDFTCIFTLYPLTSHFLIHFITCLFSMLYSNYEYLLNYTTYVTWKATLVQQWSMSTEKSHDKKGFYACFINVYTK